MWIALAFLFVVALLIIVLAIDAICEVLERLWTLVDFGLREDWRKKQ